MDVFLLISAAPTTASSRVQNGESTDSGDNSAQSTEDASSEETEQTDNATSTEDDVSSEKEGDDSEKPAEEQSAKEKPKLPTKNMSSNFILFGTLTFLRFPMATVNDTLASK